MLVFCLFVCLFFSTFKSNLLKSDKVWVGTIAPTPSIINAMHSSTKINNKHFFQLYCESIIFSPFQSSRSHIPVITFLLVILYSLPMFIRQLYGPWNTGRCWQQNDKKKKTDYYALANRPLELCSQLYHLGKTYGLQNTRVVIVHPVNLLHNFKIICEWPIIIIHLTHALFRLNTKLCPLRSTK